MYATCMFCNRSLGSNQVVELFPIGRRLAFDAHRGRLWVVCRKCERWNLTPIEERWEAIEACERLFRGTRVRVSSENVGLARHPEGLELVRIGEPMRPEFAAWRYGDQFGRRRKRAILYGVGGAAFVGAVAVAGVAGGVSIGFIGQIPSLLASRTLVKLRTEDGLWLKLNDRDLKGTRLRPTTSAGDGGFELWLRRKGNQHRFDGEEARKLTAVVLPKINRQGGRRDTVQDAVAEIEHFGHPEAFLADVVTGARFTDRKGVPGYVNKMPTETKLALEMALHEEQERRALEGELWRLERAWEEAEEIAAISDSLLLPEGTDTFLEEHRERPPSAGAGDIARA